MQKKIWLDFQQYEFLLKSIKIHEEGKPEEQKEEKAQKNGVFIFLLYSACLEKFMVLCKKWKQCIHTECVWEMLGWNKKCFTKEKYVIFLDYVIWNLKRSGTVVVLPLFFNSWNSLFGY